MKKRFLLSLALAVVMLFAVTSVALADSPTTVDINWDGGGIVVGVVGTGATTTTFGVNAASAVGSFTATDSNDNPYSYGTDTNTAYFNGTLAGGWMDFGTVRNTGAGMYGSAGQSIYSYVGSSGTGAMATGSGTNYAAMTNGTYAKPHTAGGYNFEADALGQGSYQITSTISASGAIAWFNSLGTGSSLINNMTTGASSVSNVNLGWGAGCYTNANALFTGVGSFQTYASGQNGITTPIAGANGAMVPGGWTASGASTLNTIMSFVNGGSVGNFSIDVN